MLTANDARAMADEAYASVQKILDNIFTEIEAAAQEGKYELSYTHPEVVIKVDSYRYNPSGFQNLIIRRLNQQGFFARVEREEIVNVAPGPVMDMQFIHIQW